MKIESILRAMENEMDTVGSIGEKRKKKREKDEYHTEKASLIPTIVLLVMKNLLEGWKRSIGKKNKSGKVGIRNAKHHFGHFSFHLPTSAQKDYILSPQWIVVTL